MRILRHRVCRNGDQKYFYFDGFNEFKSIHYSLVISNNYSKLVFQINQFIEIAIDEILPYVMPGTL